MSRIGRRDDSDDRPRCVLPVDRARQALGEGDEVRVLPSKLNRSTETGAMNSALKLNEAIGIEFYRLRLRVDEWSRRFRSIQTNIHG